jgi:hypothetical protein
LQFSGKGLAGEDDQSVGAAAAIMKAVTPTSRQQQ